MGEPETRFAHGGLGGADARLAGRRSEFVRMCYGSKNSDNFIDSIVCRGLIQAHSCANVQGCDYG